MGTRETLEGLRPGDGEFALVEVETGAPVGEAGHKLVEFDDADGVAIPPDTDFEKYVVYDRGGNSYTRDSWPEPFARAPDGADEKADVPGYMSRGGRNY